MLVRTSYVNDTEQLRERFSGAENSKIKAGTNKGVLKGKNMRDLAEHVTAELIILRQLQVAHGTHWEATETIYQPEIFAKGAIICECANTEPSFEI